MNDGAQEMSPDFVLMRLVAAAEDDQLDQENGNLPRSNVGTGFSPAGLPHHHHHHHHHIHHHQYHHHHFLLKGGFELDFSGAVNAIPQQQRQGPGCRPVTPAVGPMQIPSCSPPLPLPPPPPPPPPPLPPAPLSSGMSDFTHRPISAGRPQLMVFRNLLRTGEGNGDDGPEEHGYSPDRPAVPGATAACSGGMLPPRPPKPLSPRWHLHPRVKLTSSGPTEVSVPTDLCPRHRLATEHSDICSGDPVLDLVTKFGEFGVEQASKMLLQAGSLSHCLCHELLAPANMTVGPGEDPTETSDALLVLEGLESGDDLTSGNDSDRVEESPGAGMAGLTGLVLRRAGESCCPGYRDPAVIQQRPGSLVSPAISGASSPNGSTLELPMPQQELNQKCRVGRCASSPLAAATGGMEQDRSPRVPAKSRKGSLKIRLSKLFRTKSCSGGATEPQDKRHSVELVSVRSLGDVSDSAGGDSEADRKPRLTRTQSAFSPASFSPVFTGETVSLVDVDISRRGLNSTHPPTPPPPPRRSLSLLDDISRPQPGPFLDGPMGASFQSLPLPPSSSHVTLQHSISLNDTFLRVLPIPSSLQSDVHSSSVQSLPPQALHCPISRSVSSSFAASLRELEKCGWYWGPMTWEDAEVKLKGKPDGSFLVRDSSDPRYILSLSFRSQSITHHTRMEHYRGTFSLWCHPKFEDRCQSVVEFIERAIMHSKNGKFLYFLRSRVPGLPPTPVQLLYPVSRFSNVRSLQHLCRFLIRQLVRIDHLPQLPLPKPLLTYLRKFYYYDPEEEITLSLKEAQAALSPESDAEPQT
uniref:Suppressor of cytokine signaling 7 n=1 Tax=Erpetoichthys calabaricus TaxID=27687 RepID=A0A8C4TMP9_ERPCA